MSAYVLVVRLVVGCLSQDHTLDTFYASNKYDMALKAYEEKRAAVGQPYLYKGEQCILVDVSAGHRMKKIDRKQ